MKKARKIIMILASCAMLTALTACDGMMLGVDTDAGYGGPYYGSGWLDGYYGPSWTTPLPPSQPVVVNPTPAKPQQPNVQPPQQSGQPNQPNITPSQPSQPSQPSNPEGVVGQPVGGNMQRPGNSGRP